MPEPTLGGFAPFNEAHAIVSVQATVQFAGAVSDAQWAAMRQAIRGAGRALDLGHPVPAFGLAVNFDGARLGVTLNSPPVSAQQTMGMNFSVYDNEDRLAERFSANKDSIQIQTNQYIRWRPFSSRVEQFLSHLYKYYNYELPFMSIQLDYWDRFDLVDSKEVNPAMLIAADGPWVVPAGLAQEEPWHSHSGRFEKLTDKVRRLSQSKVDYGDFPGKNGRPVRSFIIYTMKQDMLNAPTYGRTIGMGWRLSEVLDALDRQHDALKDDLRRIITPQAAERIGL